MNADQERRAYQIVLERDPEPGAPLGNRSGWQFINDAAGEIAQRRAAVAATDKAKQDNINLFQGYINDRDKIIADQGHQIGEQATQIAGQADQIKTLTSQVSDLTKQVADLKAQIAACGSGEDSVQLNALGAALKWFIARLGLK